MRTKAHIASGFVKLLVYANVFIAIAAVAHVLVTYALFPVPVNFENNAYLLFIFLSTYLQYNVQRGYMINPANVATERSQWLIKNRKKLLISLGLSLVLVLFLCNNLSYTSIGIMVGAEVISTFYYLPPFNLRKQGYIKPFLISVIWVISCSVVPLIEHDLITAKSYFFFISQFCFVSALCFLFDIKDMETDYMNGINTYANKFGVKTTKFLCLFLVLICGLSFYLYTTDSRALMAEAVALGLTVLAVLFINDKRSDFYYYLLVDGLLIVQAILFCGFFMV